MVERIIELSAKHRWVVFGLVAVLVLWAADSVRKTPLDAVPDLSDPQVIVYTEWMGRSPDLVEDQITYPLVRALQSTAGVRTVRGYSMFGMSFTYVLFDEGTDLYWARTRVSEQMARAAATLPPGVTPALGPDASGVGWVYQYVLHDSTGRRDLAEKHGAIFRGCGRCRALKRPIGQNPHVVRRVVRERERCRGCAELEFVVRGYGFAGADLQH